MKKNLIKAIISEEVKKELKEKRLYVFDFDDTLVTDTANIYVVEPDGKKRIITSSEYHRYVLKPNEHVDVSDFENVTNPIIHEDIMALLKKHLSNAMILTARNQAGPIRHFMNKLGVKVPRVVAVGIYHPDKSAVLLNAKRKKAWLNREIVENKVTYIEVWDDNRANIQQISSLEEVHPDVTVVTHLVRHNVPTTNS